MTKKRTIDDVDHALPHSLTIEDGNKKSTTRRKSAHPATKAKAGLQKKNKDHAADEDNDNHSPTSVTAENDNQASPPSEAKQARKKQKVNPGRSNSTSVLPKDCQTKGQIDGTRNALPRSMIMPPSPLLAKLPSILPTSTMDPYRRMQEHYQRQEMLAKLMPEVIQNAVVHSARAIPTPQSLLLPVPKQRTENKANALALPSLQTQPPPSVKGSKRSNVPKAAAIATKRQGKESKASTTSKQPPLIPTLQSFSSPKLVPLRSKTLSSCPRPGGDSHSFPIQPPLFPNCSVPQDNPLIVQQPALSKMQVPELPAASLMRTTPSSATVCLEPQPMATGKAMPMDTHTVEKLSLPLSLSQQCRMNHAEGIMPLKKRFYIDTRLAAVSQELVLDATKEPSLPQTLGSVPPITTATSVDAGIATSPRPSVSDTTTQSSKSGMLQFLPDVDKTGLKDLPESPLHNAKKAAKSGSSRLQDNLAVLNSQAFTTPALCCQPSSVGTEDATMLLCVPPPPPLCRRETIRPSAWIKHATDEAKIDNETQSVELKQSAAASASLAPNEARLVSSPFPPNSTLENTAPAICEPEYHRNHATSGISTSSDSPKSNQEKDSTPNCVLNGARKSFQVASTHPVPPHRAQTIQSPKRVTVKHLHNVLLMAPPKPTPVVAMTSSEQKAAPGPQGDDKSASFRNGTSKALVSHGGSLSCHVTRPENLNESPPDHRFASPTNEPRGGIISWFLGDLTRPLVPSRSDHDTAISKSAGEPVTLTCQWSDHDTAISKSAGEPVTPTCQRLFAGYNRPKQQESLTSTPPTGRRKVVMPSDIPRTDHSFHLSTPLGIISNNRSDQLDNSSSSNGCSGRHCSEREAMSHGRDKCNVSELLPSTMHHFPSGCSAAPFGEFDIDVDNSEICSPNCQCNFCKFPCQDVAPCELVIETVGENQKFDPEVKLPDNDFVSPPSKTENCSLTKVESLILDLRGTGRGIDSAIARTTTPSANDVLCGRGLGQCHIGTTVYRLLVLTKAGDFADQDDYGKRQIAASIVKEIREKGGRFLTKLGERQYCDIGNQNAFAKVMEALKSAMYSEQRDRDRQSLQLDSFGTKANGPPLPVSYSDQMQKLFLDCDAPTDADIIIYAGTAVTTGTAAYRDVVVSYTDEFFTGKVETRKAIATRIVKMMTVDQNRRFLIVHNNQVYKLGEEEARRKVYQSLLETRLKKQKNRRNELSQKEMKLLKLSGRWSRRMSSAVETTCKANGNVKLSTGIVSEMTTAAKKQAIIQLLRIPERDDRKVVPNHAQTETPDHPDVKKMGNDNSQLVNPSPSHVRQPSYSFQHVPCCEVLQQLRGPPFATARFDSSSEANSLIHMLSRPSKDGRSADKTVGALQSALDLYDATIDPRGVGFDESHNASTAPSQQSACEESRRGVNDDCLLASV